MMVSLQEKDCACVVSLFQWQPVNARGEFDFHRDVITETIIKSVYSRLFLLCEICGKATGHGNEEDLLTWIHIQDITQTRKVKFDTFINW